MGKIAVYSLLLLLGLLISQLAPFYGHWSELATMFCLCYIMIDVGLEFALDKSKLSSYGMDYLIAMSAAALPWLFCSLYFWWVLEVPLREALLTGRFAAPTSAGVLFAMLAAAGLGMTWLFKKARILAIFDDLDTILLMVPLQIMFIGFSLTSLLLVILISAILCCAYIFLRALPLPTTTYWLLAYSALTVIAVTFIQHHLEIQIEALLPAFAFGCMLKHPHGEEAQELPTAPIVDSGVKYIFMFLVGCSMPALEMRDLSWTAAAFHVLSLTLLSNIGKLVPFFCYREEASLRERLALSVAMFPRGEVGAGVLMIAGSYGLSGDAVALGALSLALNLALTGGFIWSVLLLVGPPTCQKTSSS